MTDSHQTETVFCCKSHAVRMWPPGVCRHIAEFRSNFTLYMWEKWTETIVWWKLWVHECDPH